AKVMWLGPRANGEPWFDYAGAHLLGGDRPGYRRTCAHMLVRCQTTAQMSHYLAARACTLAPGSTDDPMEPFRLAAEELARNEKDYWAFTELAALHFRTGGATGAGRPPGRSLGGDGRPRRGGVYAALVAASA